MKMVSKISILEQPNNRLLFNLVTSGNVERQFSNDSGKSVHSVKSKSKEEEFRKIFEFSKNGNFWRNCHYSVMRHMYDSCWISCKSCLMLSAVLIIYRWGHKFDWTSDLSFEMIQCEQLLGWVNTEFFSVLIHIMSHWQWFMARGQKDAIYS